MPSNWLYIDSNFPTFTGEESLKEQVTTIQNYMYMLVEQLRYTLHNLDLSNMNEAAVDDWENAITEPIYIHLEDSDERITQLAITAAGLSARMEDAEGNITTLQATATGLAAQITDAEGDIAALQVTADGLSSTVANQAGQISSLQQTVGSFSLSVSNGESSSTIYLSANGAVIDSARVTFTGMVLFADLETSGATVINGDNITTGTIFADIIHLGGQMDVYRTASGFSLGGYIGYMSGMTASGSSTAGIAIASSNEAAVVICTTNGARMGYDGVSTVVCTSTQVSITGDTVFINGEPAATSDARLKTEKQYDVEKYLGVFDRLKPCTFVYEGHKRRHLGLIAQEVQEALADEGIPESDFAALCTEPPGEERPDGLYTLRYGEIQIMAIAKIQQMAEEIAKLKEQVAALSAGKEQDMKITLMEAVMANLAAEEVGRQAVPYSLALALMKVKQATAAEAETFAAEERKLVEKFAAKDEDGNIRVAQGRFTFRAPGERGEYEEQHRQLAETPAEIRFTKLRAPAPDTISVKSLEVLSRFIDFRGGDRK